jgi:hypothetical protein
MYNKFINKCDELLSSFKEIGDIESLLHLEAHISEFLDFAIDDYLDETNDSYINDGNTSLSNTLSINWKVDSTI